jgi:hypothetical protein
MCLVARQGVAVARELLNLFQAFASEEGQHRGSGKNSGEVVEAKRRQIVDPSLLREALADMDSHAFSIGVAAFCF